MNGGFGSERSRWLEIRMAKSSGFCHGVKRAVDIAFEAAEGAREGPVVTLGPIIHNPQVVGRLEGLGVRATDSLEGVSEGKVVIRSHGIPKEEKEAALARGLEVVDATCPDVITVHDFAAELDRDGYFVIVVGNKDHPEVRGILSYAKAGNIVCVKNAREALALKRKRRVGVVSQTTETEENFSEVVAALARRTPELRVYNTICGATHARQDAAQDLAGEVDCMVVVGGRNSSNTRHLKDLCEAVNPRTHHIEVADELDPDWFRATDVIGITAGASTPDWIVEEVREKIRSFEGRTAA